MSNQNNNNPNAAKENTQKENGEWRNWLSLFLYAVLGLAIGYALAKGVMYLMNSPSGKKIANIVTTNINSTSTQDKNVVNDAGLTEYVGTTTAVFEGDHSAVVNFKNNSNLKVTQGAGSKSRYFYITDANGNNVATIYMSYEGGRGYSASDYIAEVISRAVPAVSAPSIVKYADSSWLYASSVNSEWHVAPAKDGEWLVVMENKKSSHDLLKSVYETLNIK